MGWDIKIKTDKTFKAYLTLGLLEYSKEELGSRPLSQKTIVEQIDFDGTVHRNYVNRNYLGSALDWLIRADLTEQEAKELVKVSDQGAVLTDYIPESAYKDFLGAFLHLALIQDKQHTNYLEDLINKEGEKALSLVTKLVIMKNKGKCAKIRYLGEEKCFQIKIKRINLMGNKWYVSGKKTENDLEIDLELSKIIKIINFNIDPIS